MADIATIVDINSLDIAQLERLRDACNRRLLELRRTHGLTLPELLRLFEETKTALTDQHKEWRSLERWQWVDGEIRFWLNPTDQENYRSGWFSIDDLIAWLRNAGPIVVYPETDEAEDFDELEEAEAAGEQRWSNADGVKITWLPEERRNAEARVNLA